MTVRRPTLSSSSSRKQKMTLSNSRHFTCTRLIKTCCPNPNPNPNPATPCYNSPIVAISKKTWTSTWTTTIHSLPDDILYDILSRVPLPSLPSVSSVCRRWSHLLQSDSFTLIRRQQCRLHPTIFAFSFSNSTSSSSSFCTLRPYVDNSWNVIVSSQLSRLPGIPHARVTALGGRKVFVITRLGCCFLYDTWTGVVQPRSRSGPIHPRKRFAVASINGKVYVAGGSASTSALEEFNPDTNEWSVVSNAPRKRYGCIGASVDNVFFIIGGLKIGGACASDTRAAVSGAEARVYGGSMEVYDTAARGWLRSRTVPGGGCVVAACGANGYLYVLASHAVELSFWRFNARRKRGSFGEWSRLPGPPVSGLGGRVKYSLVGVEDKVVVLIQVIVGCINELLLLRRNARNVGCNKDGIVLIFDCLSQEWCRGPNLPDFVRKADCVSVDC